MVSSLSTLKPLPLLHVFQKAFYVKPSSQHNLFCSKYQKDALLVARKLHKSTSVVFTSHLEICWYIKKDGKMLSMVIKWERLNVHHVIRCWTKNPKIWVPDSSGTEPKPFYTPVRCSNHWAMRDWDICGNQGHLLHIWHACSAYCKDQQCWKHHMWW